MDPCGDISRNDPFQDISLPDWDDIYPNSTNQGSPLEDQTSEDLFLESTWVLHPPGGGTLRTVPAARVLL